MATIKLGELTGGKNGELVKFWRSKDVSCRIAADPIEGVQKLIATYPDGREADLRPTIPCNQKFRDGDRIRVIETFKHTIVHAWSHMSSKYGDSISHKYIAIVEHQRAGDWKRVRRYAARDDSPLKAAIRATNEAKEGVPTPKMNIRDTEVGTVVHQLMGDDMVNYPTIEMTANFAKFESSMKRTTFVMDEFAKSASMFGRHIDKSIMAALSRDRDGESA